MSAAGLLKYGHVYWTGGGHFPPRGKQSELARLDSGLICVHQADKVSLPRGSRRSVWAWLVVKNRVEFPLGEPARETLDLPGGRRPLFSQCW